MEEAPEILFKNKKNNTEKQERKKNKERQHLIQQKFKKTNSSTIPFAPRASLGPSFRL